MTDNSDSPLYQNWERGAGGVRAGNPTLLRLATHAMRTRFEIVLAEEEIPASNLRAAGEEALAEIERCETLLSVFRPDAALYAVNAQAAERSVQVDGELFAFLKRAGELTRQTGGAFDLTVGPLLDLYQRSPEPTDRDVQKALSLVGFSSIVVLDEAARTVAFTQPGVRLDAGAIGKGYALERARDLLRESGIRTALLHGGTSTVCAIGTLPGEAGWRIAIQHPRDPNALLTEVFLKDGDTLSVSGVHERAHIIDPRTGRPVTHTLLSALVCPSAVESDALSTALLVDGPLPEGHETVSWWYHFPGLSQDSSLP